MNSQETFGDMIQEGSTASSTTTTADKVASSKSLLTNKIIEAVESGHKRTQVATRFEPTQQSDISQVKSKTAIHISQANSKALWKQMDSTYRFAFLAMANQALVAESHLFKAYHRLIDEHQTTVTSIRLIGKSQIVNKQGVLAAVSSTGVSCWQSLILCILLVSCLQGCSCAPTTAAATSTHDGTEIVTGPAAIIQQQLEPAVVVLPEASGYSESQKLELANRPSHQEHQVVSKQEQIIIPAANQQLAARELSFQSSTATSSPPSQPQPQPQPTTITKASISEALPASSIIISKEEQQPLGSLIR